MSSLRASTTRVALRNLTLRLPHLGHGGWDGRSTMPPIVPARILSLLPLVADDAGPEVTTNVMALTHEFLAIFRIGRRLAVAQQKRPQRGLHWGRNEPYVARSAFGSRHAQWLGSFQF